jgi:transcriptional regulator with XRE-family HTH domain
VTTGRKKGRGRPAKALDPGSSLLAALGAKMRELRKAREMTLMRLGEATGYSWQHLGAVERGSVAPSESVVSACDRVLGAGGVLIAMLPGVIREQAHLRHAGDAVRRNGVGRDGDQDVEWGRLAACAARSSSVTSAVVDDIEAITAHQRRLYHELTSAQMLVPVDGHLGLLLSLVAVPAPGRLRQRIASAAGEAAGFAAWIWFDLGDHFTMVQRYGTARETLVDAGDVGLRAYVAAYQAVTSDAVGRIDDAIGHAAMAVEMARRSVQPLTRSWLYAVHATVHARAGDSRTALAGLADAHDALERSDGGRDEWMYDFDYQRLLGYEGNCLLELGRLAEAARSFERALSGVPATCVRRRAEISLDLAQVLVRQGELGEAVRLAREAITVFLNRGSVAGVSHVRRLRECMVAQRHTTAVCDLDDFVRSWEG